MRHLVTGSTGFVGRALVRRLLEQPEARVTAVSRSAAGPMPERAEPALVADFGSEAAWDPALSGVSTVFHLAARVHVMHDTASDPLLAFRQVNVDATLALARRAAAAGVRRFVFVSSIKVNGESTDDRSPFSADDTPAPQDPYGISKLEAELALRELSVRTGMELVVVRPPLVYGPGVRANFLRMMNWLQRGIPLPFGAIDNRRSLIALDNLTDLLATCGSHPAAGGQTFLASDGEDLSTAQLLRRLGHALGHPARLLPVPPALLKFGFALAGKHDLAVRLCGSLEIDIAKSRRLLDWQPPVGVDQALARAAQPLLPPPS